MGDRSVMNARVAPLGLLMVLGVPVLAYGQGRGEAEPAIQSGLRYLRSQASGLDVGQSALTALAMHKADVPNSDPTLQALVQRILERFTEQGYVPERRGGHDLYEAAVVAMALANIDPVGFKPQVQAVAQYLISKQKGNGSWDYDGRTAGDSSISQYALLGLWEADGIGVAIPPAVWDNAALWYARVQFPNGAWNYHPDQPNYLPTVSMTAAGAGSLLICQRQLAPYRKGTETVHPLLTPLVVEGSLEARYKPVSTVAGVNYAIRRGIEFLGLNFQPEGSIMGPSTYYGMYGIERVAALAEKETLGPLANWFEKGMAHILRNQKADGSWSGTDAAHGVASNTCWAILFLTRSTAASARKIEIRRLGAGTLLGGRGLPSDMTNLTIAQGRIVPKPMSGAVDSMIAVLEDPRATNADSALAGLVDRYTREGPSSLRPFKDRFGKLLRDRDPGIRRVACWALARIGDLDSAPDLILALLDPDDAVSVEARVGLELLSRKVQGLGPPRGASPEEKLAAARRWRDWYETIRPPALEPLDDVALERAAAAARRQDHRP
ncbi:MAG: hypothetical protein KatS3mg108_2977 [Isosphaeraceae bacterium]|jgi:hypothetical protein|nr:MAG: hypothetical protein KatS3mg108_2977 [Isosphaeraceae bacterium]